MSEVTRILRTIELGDPMASEALLPLVYNELRQLAARKIAQEGEGFSLQGTALVHEAYLRLVDTENVQTWDSRGHFFAAAAEAMRRILVEHARQKQCVKRGGDRRKLELNDFLPDPERSEELLTLNDALGELKTHDAQAYQLVMLRYFGGLGHQEAAEAMGLSRRVADRMWAVARVWLHEYVSELKP